MAQLAAFKTELRREARAGRGIGLSALYNYMGTDTAKGLGLEQGFELCHNTLVWGLHEDTLTNTLQYSIGFRL